VRILFIVVRALGAIAIAAAIIAQLLRTLTFETDAPGWDLTFMMVNFFSFFTIDSNVLSVATLAIGAVLLLKPRPAGAVDPHWFTMLRLSATTYMTVTFIVYNLLLRGIELPQGQTVPWSNEILHVVGPLVLIVDWLFAPGRPRIEWKAIGTVVVFPIVWAVYTLVRGPLAIDGRTGLEWYPYPFLNPANSPSGYFSVAFYVILIAAIIGLTSAGAIAISRRWAPKE